MNTFEFEDEQDYEVEPRRPPSPLKRRQETYKDRHTGSFQPNILKSNMHQEQYKNPSDSREEKKNSPPMGGEKQNQQPEKQQIISERQQPNIIVDLDQADLDDQQDPAVMNFSTGARFNLPKVEKGQLQISADNFLFDDNDEPLHITRNQKGNTANVFDQSSIGGAEIHEVLKAEQYFDMNSRAARRDQIMGKVEQKHVLKMTLIRDNSFLKSFWPEFKISFGENGQGIAFAKRTTARPIATFILSLKQDDFEEDSPNYLGKMKSNALGDVLNVFGPGQNPSNAKENRVEPRQLLASVVFDAAVLGNNGKPREFQVFAKQEGTDYFKDFDGDEDEEGYHQKFRHQEYRDKLIVFNNRKPIWSKQRGAFYLNFSGRVKQPSIKNFILDDPHGNESLLFGKLKDNLFALHINDTISPYLAFATALAAFDTKLILE